jgi:putative sigma-54 modulation protein
MQIQMTGQNTDITPAIRDYVEKKLKRLNALSDKITHIHLTFHVEKINQIAEANLTVPGLQVHAKASSEDMYESIDKLVDKIGRQLSKHKEKMSGQN